MKDIVYESVHSFHTVRQNIVSTIRNSIGVAAIDAILTCQWKRDSPK